MVIYIQFHSYFQAQTVASEQCAVAFPEQSFLAGISYYYIIIIIITMNNNYTSH